MGGGVREGQKGRQKGGTGREEGGREEGRRGQEGGLADRLDGEVVEDEGGALHGGEGVAAEEAHEAGDGGAHELAAVDREVLEGAGQAPLGLLVGGTAPPWCRRGGAE